MRLLTKVSTALIALSILAPAASAKIYPDDFMIPGQVMMNGSSSSSMEMPSSDSSSSLQSIFMATNIPQGSLTRFEFIDAIVQRLYDARLRAGCFADLAPSQYTLLFSDVPVSDPTAVTTCMAMQFGLMRGYRDGTFRPNQKITTAEAASVLAKINGMVRPAKTAEAWYAPSMEAMRSVDREFTMGPGEIFTGVQLRHTMCVLSARTPQLDPLGEFAGHC